MAVKQGYDFVTKDIADLTRLPGPYLTYGSLKEHDPGGGVITFGLHILTLVM